MFLRLVQPTPTAEGIYRARLTMAVTTGHMPIVYRTEAGFSGFLITADSVRISEAIMVFEERIFGVPLWAIKDDSGNLGRSILSSFLLYSLNLSQA